VSLFLPISDGPAVRETIATKKCSCRSPRHCFHGRSLMCNTASLQPGSLYPPDDAGVYRAVRLSLFSAVQGISMQLHHRIKRSIGACSASPSACRFACRQACTPCNPIPARRVRSTSSRVRGLTSIVHSGCSPLWESAHRPFLYRKLAL